MNLTGSISAPPILTGNVNGLTSVGYDDGYSQGFKDGLAAEGPSEYDTFWDVYQENGNRANYSHAFSGPYWPGQKVKYPIKIQPGQQSCYGMFYRYAYDGRGPMGMADGVNLTDFANVDFSEATHVDSVFGYSTFKTVIVDFSNATSALACFETAFIRNIYIRLSEKCTQGSTMFRGAMWTDRIIFTDDSVLNINQIDFTSPYLDHESVLSIVKALKDYSGSTSSKICKLGSGNLSRLSNAEKAIATEKGWTLT